MKECSGKKVLIVKVSQNQNDPLDPSSQKNRPSGQQDQGHGVVLHVQEEPYLSIIEVSKVKELSETGIFFSEKFIFEK